MDENIESSSVKNDSVFGRKLFFVNPSDSIQKNIIDPLKDKEYETYVIDDYRDAKNILNLNPDSICYIHTEGLLSKNGWFNFIQSIQQQSNLCNLYIGIISEKLNEETKELYLDNLNISAGLIILDESLNIIFTEVLELLQSINAKGRRQYVRAKLINDKQSCLIWTFDSKMLKFNIRDISSVGLAIEIPPTQVHLFVQNKVIDGLTIKLGQKQLQIKSLVYTVKQVDKNFIGVLIIKSNHEETKKYIKSYIAKTLQNHIYTMIRELPQDSTDYESIQNITNRE